MKTHFATVAVLLSLASPLSAQEKDSHPLRESLTWGAVMAGTSYVDLATTMSWSSRPSSCIEGNHLLANADGTANGPKSVMMKGAFIAGMTVALYVGKKLHMKPVEVTAKAVISANSGMYAYYSIKSLAVCR